MRNEVALARSAPDRRYSLRDRGDGDDLSAAAERPVTLLPGQDRELAAGICSACHSLDYITTQPRGKGVQYWKDSVAKMVTVYGAPIEPADADRIAAYLGATYGTMPGDSQGR